MELLLSFNCVKRLCWYFQRYVFLFEIPLISNNIQFPGKLMCRASRFKCVEILQISNKF